MPSLADETERSLSRRQQSPSTAAGPNPVMIVAIVVAFLLALALVVFAVFRTRRKTKADAKYLPGDTALSKFKKWRQPKPDAGTYSASLQPNPSAPSLIGRDGRRSSRDTSREASFERRRDHDPERGQLGTRGALGSRGGLLSREGPSEGDVGVDRNTSVRSVMTLPSYTPAARPTEQVIAREGERAGVDTVIEFPEGDDEEEARREEEMESLYQIRRQRREEQAEREERRRQRRAARERGDMDTVRRLRLESRQRADAQAQTAASTSAALIAEHQEAMAGRKPKVSRVQYAAIGVARHDGSRISIDSDNRPLLDSAASISGLSLDRPSMHARPRSGSSVLSVDSQDIPHIDSDGFEVVSLSQTETNVSLPHSTRTTYSGWSGYSRHRADSDLADVTLQIPDDDPPDYASPPDYTSPIETRNRIPSSLAVPPTLPIPSIEVTSVHNHSPRSPAHSSADSPTQSPIHSPTRTPVSAAGIGAAPPRTGTRVT